MSDKIVEVPEVKHELQVRLDAAIDLVLDALTEAEAVGFELDPLATIIERFQARGNDFDLTALPLPLQMLLAGMLG